MYVCENVKMLNTFLYKVLYYQILYEMGRSCGEIFFFFLIQNLLLYIHTPSQQFTWKMSKNILYEDLNYY